MPLLGIPFLSYFTSLDPFILQVPPLSYLQEATQQPACPGFTFSGDLRFCPNILISDHINLYVHSFHIYLLGAYYAPGSGDLAIDTADKSPCFTGSLHSGGVTRKKKKKTAK